MTGAARLVGLHYHRVVLGLGTLGLGVAAVTSGCVTAARRGISTLGLGIVALAAGAMLALIAVELLPKAYAGREWLSPSGGLVLEAALMLALSFALGV